MVGEQDGLGTAEHPVIWGPSGELGWRLMDTGLWGPGRGQQSELHVPGSRSGGGGAGGGGRVGRGAGGGEGPLRPQGL